MTESLKMTTILKSSPQEVYEAWLDSKAHAEFTGGAAEIDPKVGGEFHVWDGYIWGINLVLEPSRRILQSWITSDFPENAPASQLELIFDPVEEGCQVTLIHTNIPEGQSEEYEKGWVDYYFYPMKVYFERD
jgi:activator of HSP90 ATPase